MRNRRTAICLCHIAAALLAGAIFYIFFRKGTYLHTLLQTCFRYQPPFISVDAPIPAAICNHFGDFMWAYALCCALLILFPYSKYASWIAVLCTSALGTGLELLQRFSVVSGTFDTADIGAELIAALITDFRKLSARQKESVQLVVKSYSEI